MAGFDCDCYVVVASAIDDGAIVDAARADYRDWSDLIAILARRCAQRPCHFLSRVVDWVAFAAIDTVTDIALVSSGWCVGVPRENDFVIAGGRGGTLSLLRVARRAQRKVGLLLHGFDILSRLRLLLAQS